MKENLTKAYNEILEVVGKYKDICVFDYGDLERKAKYHLFGIELKEIHGLDINPRDIYSLDWNNLRNYVSVGWFGEIYKRTISWSDNGKQPENELLLYISFPTGAYIFGDDYPVSLFQEFFQELKSYNPKYTDTTNKGLYFSMENSGKVFDEFSNILKKYNELNKVDSKKRKINLLQAELEKLNQ